MFTLAQYVFGIGKPNETITDDNCASNDTAYDNDPNQCVQTSIENDWILIELDQKNSTLAKDEAKPVLPPRKSKLKSKGKVCPLEKLQSQEESWFVDPPECFKNSSPDSRDVKTSSLEDLLIEHPSMSVFDNFFTKRVSIPKTEPARKQRIAPHHNGIETFKASGKKNENSKENTVAVRSNKKKVDSVSVNVLTVSNQNKSLTAVIHSKCGDTFHKKKNITKKNYERKNKVAVQRNGPIIRHKKMFAHLNGTYCHTRHQC